LHWRKLFIQLIYVCITYMGIGAAAFASMNGEGIQVYQKNMHLSPEHKQKLADDISRYRNADNIWDILREEFSLEHYDNNPAVQQKIEWYMNNQDFLLRSASRAAPYLYYILQQVKKRHLPAELVLLPIVESGYNPFNRSPVGAVGIWQLMPGTASGLGVKRNAWYDGRRDVIASTRAALNYLGYLQSFFEGNWLLAMAAYNTGEGNVLAAIKRNIRDGLDTGFWSLPVAQETRDYVPSLLALAVIISHPRQYPIYFPPVQNAPYMAQVDIGTQINLKYAASLAGISYHKLMQLNPGFSKRTTTTKAPYKLVLPIENVEQFTENFARSPLSQPLQWLHYKVKTGDTLAMIAKKFKTIAADIRKLNHLSKNSLHPGIHLLIPNTHGTDFSDDNDSMEDSLAENKKTSHVYAKTKLLAHNQKRIRDTTTLMQASHKYALQAGDTIYMVRKNDTIEKIAHRFHSTSETIRLANRLNTHSIKPGVQIIIPTHRMIATQEVAKIAPGDTIYMVRRGDTIEKIARKFHTSTSSIRITNLVDNESLSEGDKLIIPTHLRA